MNNLNSNDILVNHIASFMVSIIVIYLTSVVDKVTTNYIFTFQLTTPLKAVNTKPVKDFLASIFLA